MIVVWHTAGMSKPLDLTQLSADQLRTLTAELMTSLAAKEQLLNQKDRVIVHRDAVIEKLSHELATLKRHKYAQRSEQMNDLQASLLDECPVNSSLTWRRSGQNYYDVVFFGDDQCLGFDSLICTARAWLFSV